MWLFLIILGIITSIVGVVGYNKGWFRGMNPPLIKKISLGFGVLFIIVGILLTSILFVPTKHTAHLIKKYGSKLDGNRVIAINGERGRQAEILQEGLNISLFVNVIYDVEFVPYEIIGEGQVGLLTSVDGSPLGKDLYIAPDWLTMFSENKIVKVNDSVSYDTVILPENRRSEIETMMLDPKYFIEHGGKKGPQLNVLRPGEYKINKYMWKVEIVDATRIPDGHVGVIISRVGKVPQNIQVGAEGNTLATPVVDKGYMGVWKEPLKPGMYYLNRHPDKNKGAYEVKLVDTRIQTWTYKGGYDWYVIDLSIEENGKIEQTISKTTHKKIPDGATGGAIRIMTKDGWTIFIDGRILIQIQPQDAPYIIASVGGIPELKDKITTPLMRSVCRNVGEHIEATNFVLKRSTIEKEIEDLLIEGSSGTRLTVKEYKMNDVYVKPELLIPDKRKQLAKKMETTYAQEQLAYKEKIKTEKAREEAEQQGVLVEAKIAKQAAAEFKEAEYLKGQGTKLRMIEEAKGQEKLKEVLGEQKTFVLELTKSFKDLPSDAWNTPFFYGGGGNGSNGAYTAITIRQMIQTMNDMGIDPVVIDNAVAEYNKKVKNDTIH